MIGQVASQTLDNMAVTDSATRLPIFRPLVGMDKEEIMAQAAAPRHLRHLHRSRPGLLHAVHAPHPETHARRHQIDEVEAALPIAEMVKEAAVAGGGGALHLPGVRRLRQPWPR